MYAFCLRNHTQASPALASSLNNFSLFSRPLLGLRGAVAYACANIFPDEKGNREVVVTTTMVIALVTILLKGGYTVRMLENLKIQTGVDAQPFADKVCIAC